MKKIFLYNMIVIFCASLNAQDQTTNTGNIKTYPGATLTFYGDFANNGAYTDEGQAITFGGSVQQVISGSSNTSFSNLSINNSAGVSLQCNIGVSGNLQLIAGDLDLRNSNVDLGTTGTLVNETNDHRIIATDGITEGMGTGTVNFSKNLSTGFYTNIGGLGLDISTPSDMGLTSIFVGHFLQSNGTNTSISRYYDIVPQNNSGLNATFRFYYLDAETGGQDESGFVLWKSDDNGLTWTVQMPSAIDNIANYVEENEVTSFSRWTISNIYTNPLPVELVSFSGICTNGVAVLEWSTLSEINNNYFTVERSDDGYSFTEISRITAAGTSNQINKYSYNDINSTYSPVYYRLKQSDFNEVSEYIGITGVSCNSDNDLSVEIYPNPVVDVVNVSFSNTDFSDVQITIYNSQGKIIREEHFSGNPENICRIDISGESTGVYFLRISSAESQIFNNRLILTH